MIARISRRVVARGDKSGYHGSRFSVTGVVLFQLDLRPKCRPPVDSEDRISEVVLRSIAVALISL